VTLYLGVSASGEQHYTGPEHAAAATNPLLPHYSTSPLSPCRVCVCVAVSGN